MLKEIEDIVCIYGEPDIDNYYDLTREVKQLNIDLQEAIATSKPASSILGTGRVLQISTKVFVATVCSSDACDSELNERMY
jgi:hypothetical protein